MKMSKSIMVSAVLLMATIVWAFCYALQGQVYVYRIYMLGVAEFLLAVWLIFFLHLFLYKVYPHLRKRFKSRKIKMKMSKFKLAFIVLLIATIIWGVAFYYTLQGYREYCEWFDEQWWSKWALREPYYTWNGGKYVCVTGMFLFVAWFFFIGYFLSEKVYPYIKKRFKPELTTLEACSPPSPKGRAEREQKLKENYHDSRNKWR